MALLPMNVLATKSFFKKLGRFKIERSHQQNNDFETIAVLERFVLGSEYYCIFSLNGKLKRYF